MADYIEDDEVDDGPMDEYEEAMSNCHGFFETERGPFVCSGAGSEDCDWDCPFSRDLGLTMRQIEQRDVEEMLAEAKARREAIGNSEYDSWRDPADRRSANG